MNKNPHKNTNIENKVKAYDCMFELIPLIKKVSVETNPKNYEDLMQTLFINMLIKVDDLELSNLPGFFEFIYQKNGERKSS